MTAQAEAAKTTQYAHYTATRKVKFVTLSKDHRPVGVQIMVAGKREALAVAKAHNAKPWNF